MIKVLGINGSPRKGNSLFLLEKAMEEAAQVDTGVDTSIYSFTGKKMAGCISCFKCGDKQGECIIRDDFQELREMWIEADAIIYSVPVYHMGMPAQVKAFIDRLGNSTFGRYQHLFTEEAKLPKSLKVIGAIAQGAHIFSGQEHTITDIINHAIIMQCIPVAGDMWEAYIGVGGWTYNDNSRKALRERESEADLDLQVAIRASRNLGRRAVELGLILQAGGLAEQERFKDQPIYRPFLERVKGNRI